MKPWQNQLHYDPLSPLGSSTNEALAYFVKRDLLKEDVPPIRYVWHLPEAEKICKTQQADGSWKYPGKKPVVYPQHHYPLVETWKQFRFLVEKYEFTREHPAAQKAAEFLFSCQTEDGDIRGMIGNQYATYYTGAIMSLLIKAGYTNDPRIEKGFQWLLSMRQHDLGWTVPILTVKYDRETMYRLTSQYCEPVEPDRTKPFSHNWTGMVLRAFAAHKKYRKSKEAHSAGMLLKSRFFQKDGYTSYQKARYWVTFQYPFWWNNLVSALDSLSFLGFSKDDPDIKKALDWVIEHQQENGLWNLQYGEPKKRESTKEKEMKLWVSLAICRILKRFYG
jgi:hypothetical protein